MNISFTGKIPLYQTKVLDKSDGFYKDAKIYELDCKDDSDSDYVVYQTGDWGSLKTCISSDLYKKIKDIKNCLEQPPSMPVSKFYTIEVEDGKSIGLMETASIASYTGIRFLECNPDKNYKYAGQVMLASLAKSMEKNNDSLIFINDPADSARSFYTDKCGFTPLNKDSRELKMDCRDMQTFIKNVEEKTHQPILDISV